MDQQPAYLLKIFSLLLLVFTADAFASAEFILPPDSQSRYSITKYGIKLGEMQNTLSYQNGVINYTSIATATGMASLFIKEDPEEISILNWPENSELKRPRQQSYNYFQGKNHKKNQKISFNWSAEDKVNIEGTYKKKTYKLSSGKILWARQLLPVLMSSDLQLKPDTISDSFYITNKGNIDKYTYTLEATENLEFKNKNYPVLKFKISYKGSSRMTYAWLSKAHYYLPLKIEQYKKGALNVSMLMTDLELIQ